MLERVRDVYGGGGGDGVPASAVSVAMATPGASRVGDRRCASLIVEGMAPRRRFQRRDPCEWARPLHSVGGWSSRIEQHMGWAPSVAD